MPAPSAPSQRRASPEKSGIFLFLNTNKRGITLDLKSDEDIEALKQLVKDADILVESFRPGVMAGLGLDYDTLKGINPNLVMTSLSNFGQTGPYRDYKASELTLFGMGGRMHALGLPGAVSPEAGRQPRPVPGRKQRRDGHPLRLARPEVRGHGRAACGRVHTGDADGLHQRTTDQPGELPVQRRARAAARPSTRGGYPRVTTPARTGTSPSPAEASDGP